MTRQMVKSVTLLKSQKCKLQEQKGDKMDVYVMKIVVSVEVLKEVTVSSRGSNGCVTTFDYDWYKHS